MNENFLFHIVYSSSCVIKIGVPERGFFYSVFNSLCPHFAKTAVYSLRVSSCLQPFHVKRMSEMDHKCG